MFPAAVIRVPVKTTNSIGKSVTTESLSTAAATAFVNVVITSIRGPGSTVLETSQVPAVVYTTTNSEGAIVIITSAIVPSNAASIASAMPAPKEKFASPADDQSGSTANIGSDSPYIIDTVGGGNVGFVTASRASDQSQAAEETSESRAGASSQAVYHADSTAQGAADDKPTGPNASSTSENQAEPGEGHQDSNVAGRPQSAYHTGEAMKDYSVASNSANAQSGSHNGATSNTEPASEGRPNSNAGEGKEIGQPNSAQNSNGEATQGYQTSLPQSESGSSSDSATMAGSSSLNDSTSASVSPDSSDSNVGSQYDQLASSGPGALATNASTIAQFVQEKLASQTNAQKEAFRSQLNAQFTDYVDDLFASTSSGQPGAGSQTAQQEGSQYSQNLANQTCSSLGEMHERLMTSFFFMETTVNTVYWQYTNVRDVIVQQCQ